MWINCTCGIIILQNAIGDDNHTFYFYKVCKIASGRFYKTLKLWEFHDLILRSLHNLVKIVKIKNTIRTISSLQFGNSKVSIP